MPSTTNIIRMKGQRLQGLFTNGDANCKRYIYNLRIIIVSLLDSIHDFGSSALMSSYVNEIINKLINIIKSSPRQDANMRSLLEWINNDELKKILKIKSSCEDAAGFILNIDPVHYNYYSDPTRLDKIILDNNELRQNNHVGIIYEANNEIMIADKFIKSMFSEDKSPCENNNSFFFTIRDNGFTHKFFTYNDTHSLHKYSDTIYTGTGKWDNGGKNQYVLTTNGQRTSATNMSNNRINNYNYTSYNIINTIQNSWSFFPSTTTDFSIYHKHGGLLGYRYIRTDDPDPSIPNSGVVFRNNFMFPQTGTVPILKEYSTQISYTKLEQEGKDAVKDIIKTLFNKNIPNIINVTTNKIDKLLMIFFEDTNGVTNGQRRSGKSILNTLLQAGPVKETNRLIVLGCFLDLKRSGDFMQSACISDIEDKFQANGGKKRKGFFVTNDRIAAFISAAIHRNRTLLSVKEKDDLKLTAIWNTCNRVVRTTEQKRLVEPVRFRSRIRDATDVIVGGNIKKKNKINGGTNEKFIIDYKRFIENTSIKELKCDKNLINKIMNYINDYRKELYYFITNYIENHVHKSIELNSQKINSDYVNLCKLFTLPGENELDNSKFLFKTFLLIFFDEGTFYDIFNINVELITEKELYLLYYAIKIVKIMKENQQFDNISGEENISKLDELNDILIDKFDKILQIETKERDYPINTDADIMKLMEPSYLLDNHLHRDICGILSFYYSEINEPVNKKRLNIITSIQGELERTASLATTPKQEEERPVKKYKRGLSKQPSLPEQQSMHVEYGGKYIKTKDKKLSLKEYNEYAKKLDIKPSNSKNKVENSIKNIDVNKLNLKQLKVYCKFNNIKRYSKLNKEKIIKLLNY